MGNIVASFEPIIEVLHMILEKEIRLSKHAIEKNEEYISFVYKKSTVLCVYTRFDNVI